MTGAASAPRNAADNHWRQRQGIIAMAVLWLTALVSALGVVYSTHESRQLLNQLEVKRRITADLHIEWGQYLLERSTWAAYSQVEERAEDELQMVLPTQNNIVLIEP